MATTLVTRETIRDRLVTLFTDDNSWQKVFGYIPTESDIKGQSPFLIIIGAGTQQSMGSESMNPTAYTFIITSMVLMDDSDVGGSWTNQNAEDKLDELDLKFRQLVRNNADPVTGADALTFADGPSRTDTIELYDVLYRSEMWALTATYYSGA